MQAALQQPVNLPAQLGISRDELVFYLRVKRSSLDDWLDGRKPKPPYLDAAIKAAKLGLHPMPAITLRAYPRELGVKASHVEFWINANQVPYIARLAAAWIVHNRVTGR